MKYTPYGEVVTMLPTQVHDLIRKQALGEFQKAVVTKLLRDGWVYENVNPKTGKRGTRHKEAIEPLMQRIKNVLPFRYTLVYGKVGKKGGIGFWLYYDECVAKEV